VPRVRASGYQYFSVILCSCLNYSNLGNTTASICDDLRSRLETAKNGSAIGFLREFSSAKQMKPNLETLRHVRLITEDGVVTADEVMSLGDFLNDNITARKSWPGNVIFELLQQVFKDGRLDPCELKGLAYILRGIELQCAGALGIKEEVDDGLPKHIEFEAIDLRLPPIDSEITVEAGEGGKQSVVNLMKHECTCGDFTSRRFGFPAGSPGRACKCMVVAFRQPEVETQIPRQDWNTKFFQLLDMFTETGGSFDAAPTWRVLRHEKHEWLVSWGDREWCNVYADSNSSVERYCYNMREGRWAYGTTPFGAAALRGFFANRTGNALSGGSGIFQTLG
jgi:hypothetical protein